MSSTPRTSHNPRVAFQYRDFRYFQIARFLAIVGSQAQAIALSVQIYDMTHDPLQLGYIGLAQFLPMALLTLVTGQVADRFDRRRIVMICQAVLATASIALSLLALHYMRLHNAASPNALPGALPGAMAGTIPALWPIYTLLVIIGTARAFMNPASQALLPMIVPAEHFSNAVAWNSSTWQIATIVGPSLGGVLYEAIDGPLIVYVLDALAVLGSFWAFSRMRVRSGELERGAINLSTVLAGLRYIFERKIILGAISLDLFAVLLGGAEALLPVFARDFLNTGAWGAGLLRAGLPVGAALMALAMAHMPPLRRAGATMLWCVAGFGLCTIVFGLSRNFALSIACLVLMGALDMISVIVRHTLVQILTPREMLGRVNAVNIVFIGASNELGQFESGVTARWWGTTAAVVVGGIGTVCVVAICSALFPSLRRFGRLDQAPEAIEAQAESAAKAES